MLPAVNVPVFPVLVLTLIGMVASILAILEQHVPAIASFCALLGQGCQRTADFTLIRIPIAWWGLLFYLALAFLLTAAPVLVFPAVMAGVGFEFTFVWILISIRAFCVFCLLNALVVAGLFAVIFAPSLFWSAAAIALLFFLISGRLVIRENAEEMTRGRDTIDPPAARVNGETISTKELELPLKQALHEHELKIYHLKRERLEKMIIYRLTQEGQLPADLSDSGRRRECLDELRKRHAIEILIEKPTLPFIDVDVTGNPSTGPYNAPVIIVEFSDYLCPYCRDMHPLRKQILGTYGDRVQWIFKDFPLDMHRGAKAAAQAARCADAQGKFWEYQDLLFEGPEEPDATTFDAFARQAGLNEKEFVQCRTASRYRKPVEKDIRDGISIGVLETPTYIINGRMKSGSLTMEDFTTLINEELTPAPVA